MTSELEATRVARRSGPDRPNGGPAPIVVRILFRVFAAMGCGAMFLSEDKRLLRATGRARACMEDGLATCAFGRLVAQDRGDDARLQTTLDAALASLGREPADDDPMLRDALGLTRPERQPLIIRVIPIEGEARAVLEEAALLVVAIDPEDCPEPSHALLRQVFGLTPREARLACSLLCGESLNEVAERTGVTPGTVRSQAKALFQKTRTNRQAELVALLTRVAMISEHE
jgi:DNA-binding CsgD family transcriptional regulator